MKDLLFKNDADVDLIKQLYEFLKKKLKILQTDIQTQTDDSISFN